MSDSFPKMNESKLKGQTGQTYVEHYITSEFNWIYHGIPVEKDYGIDAYVEVVEDNRVTGKLIGIQIKHGNSYFKSKTEIGFNYFGEDKHLNYYLNSNLPIIMIILDDKFERKMWTLFDIEKTIPLQSGWSIEIPEKNVFNLNAKKKLLEFLTPIIDYQEQIKLNWAIDKVISDTDFRLIAIPKCDIDNMKFDTIVSFFKRISKNNAQMLKSRSSLDIFFPEYSEDPREIYDIPEIRKWIQETINKDVPWFYYIDYKSKNTAFDLLLQIYSKEVSRKDISGGRLIILDKNGVSNFIDFMYNNLNKFTDENNITIEINKEISLGLFDYIKKNWFFEHNEL